VRFLGGGTEDADIVSRYGAAVGTIALRNVLGRSLWKELEAVPALLDDIASVLTLAGDAEEVDEGLSALPCLADHATAALVEAYEEGELSVFSGTGRVSIRAAEQMIPFLEQVQHDNQDENRASIRMRTWGWRIAGRA
jgi:hypothetical protein